MRTLRFADRKMQGPYFHLATVEWARNRIPGCHRHDYAEIFWLTKGRCEHFLNGEMQRLEKGTLVLMRPEDSHALRPVHPRESFEFTNLALSPLVFARLKTAYPGEYQTLYSLSSPTQIPLSVHGIEAVNQNMRHLASDPHSLFAIESSVLQIWKLCLPRSPHPLIRCGPDWLQQALLKLEEPEILTRGVAGFVTAAGRSHAHVSRRCKEILKKSPGQLVTEARMRLAAHCLRTTSLSVLEVSLECGFENPSQFHRLFRKTFRVSPRKYRFVSE